jgi:hypothetical protein
MTDARVLVELMFDILDNQRYDELTPVVTEDAVKIEPQVTTHSAAQVGLQSVPSVRRARAGTGALLGAHRRISHIGTIPSVRTRGRDSRHRAVRDARLCRAR